MSEYTIKKNQFLQQYAICLCHSESSHHEPIKSTNVFHLIHSNCLIQRINLNHMMNYRIVKCIYRSTSERKIQKKYLSGRHSPSLKIKLPTALNTIVMYVIINVSNPVTNHSFYSHFNYLLHSSMILSYTVTYTSFISLSYTT